jgi:hypothetical protein
MADEDDEETEHPVGPTWQERRWKEIRGWLIALFFVGFIVFPVSDDVRNWFSPVHPPPVSIEADGKSYLACETPDIGRGFFHTTYYADFKDNNGSTISLRGIDKLIITNLPKMVDSPMPVFRTLPYPLPDVNGIDKDGKPYQEGFTYTWMDGSAATFRNHQWLSVPGLPTVTPNMEGQIITLKEDEYRVLTGGKAQVKNGRWVPIKVKNTVCNPDDGSSN